MSTKATPTSLIPQKLGRNQKIAIWCYSVPYFLTTAVMLLIIAVGLSRGTDAGDKLALDTLDKLVNFNLVYALVAVGSILVVSGAIKSADKLAALRDKFAKKPEVKDEPEG